MTALRFSTSNAFNSGFSNYAGISNGTTLGTTGVYTATNGDYTSILESRNNTLQAAESYEIADSGRDAVLSSKISNVCSYIENGQEDNAMKAYQELLAQMETQTRYAQLITEDGDDSQLRSIARQLIESETGIDLEEYIKAYTRDAKGVESQKLYRGEYCDSTTQEELLREMCDLEVEEGQLNIFEKGWHGLWGGIAKGWNSIFGDGKKH